jgi:hypothetical protein
MNRPVGNAGLINLYIAPVVHVRRHHPEYW